MTPLLDQMKAWFRENGEHLLLARFPPDDGDETELRSHDSYLRIWLCGSFLARSRDWFTDHFPAVHTTVRLDFAGRRDVTFTSVLRPAYGPAPGVYENYAVTPLIPFGGGTVELEAGLSVVHGANALSASLDLLEDFSGMIGPPLAEASGIANKVLGGVQRLFDVADGEVVLGLHQAFAGSGGSATLLRPGYLAVVNTRQHPVDAATLTIVGGQLHHVSSSGTEPLTGCDHMLFRMDRLRERDDWRLPRLEDLIRRAGDAFIQDDLVAFEIYRRAAIAEAHASPDLTSPDRVRVAKAILSELADWTAYSSAIAERGPVSLAEIVADRAPSRLEVDGLENRTLEDLLAEGPSLN